MFNLNAYLGQATVYLRFVFTSDGDASSFKFEVDDGIYIDNLKVIKSSTPMVILPVNFLNVTGTLQPDHSIRVNWDAIVDQEHDYFEVQHSTDGNAFTTLGTGPQLAPYQFVHLNPVKGNNYYRIKQVDKSGQFTYSKIVNVIVSKNITVSLYPNPVKDLLNIRIENRRSDLLKIEIADIQGRVVYKKNTLVDQNTAELVVDMKLLKPQVYILKVTNSNGEIITTEKVIKN
jgi:hypothetical protein